MQSDEKDHDRQNYDKDVFGDKTRLLQKYQNRGQKDDLDQQKLQETFYAPLL